MRALALALALVAGCGDSPDSAPAPAAPDYPADCLGLPIPDAEACVEERFWPAFQSEYDQRESVFGLISGVLDEHGDQGEATARLYLLRATLNTAMMMENRIVDHIAVMGSDLRTAAGYKPDVEFITSWALLSDVVDAHMRAENDKVETLKADIAAALERAPKYNSIVLLTLVAMPLSTGIPDMVMEVVKEQYTDRECDGRELCMENPWKVPYNLPGTELFIADGYARMGDRQNAFVHLNRATLAKGFAEWPQKSLVTDALADTDSFMAPYAELGPDDLAFEQSLGMGEVGCRMCHGLAP